jgi:DUF917 family protein
LEKLPHGGEGCRLRDEIEERLGAKVVALMCSEIGGSNGLLPVAWAAQLRLPLVDADGMGRALPEVDMVAMNVAGREPGVIAMTDAMGSVVTLSAASGAWAERLARTVTVAFGGIATIADYVMPVSAARGAVIEGSVRHALAIGRAVLGAQSDPIAALVDVVDGHRLIDGKIVDVERHTSGGFVHGNVAIAGVGDCSGRLLRIEIQNENLVVFEEGTVLACVPDLITIVDSETANAIATELLRFGQRVTVIAFESASIWRTRRGLEVAGPRRFGFDFDHVMLRRAASP